jgi:hypothetical protein
MLHSSKVGPGAAAAPAETSAPPPARRATPVSVPALPIETNMHKSSNRDESWKLNRGVMWEELMKQAVEACVILHPFLPSLTSSTDYFFSCAALMLLKSA